MIDSLFISATRVVFVYPHGIGPKYHAALFRAANRIKVALLSNSTGRMTFSSDAPTVFSSHFWDQGWQKQDQNIVIFVDLPDQSAIDIHPILLNLRTIIDADLARIGAGQPIRHVWITVHPMYILRS